VERNVGQVGLRLRVGPFIFGKTESMVSMWKGFGGSERN